MEIISIIQQDGFYFAEIKDGKSFMVANIARGEQTTRFNYLQCDEMPIEPSKEFMYKKIVYNSEYTMPANPAIDQTEPPLESWGGDLGRIITAIMYLVDSYINKKPYK